MDNDREVEKQITRQGRGFNNGLNNALAYQVNELF